MKRSLLQFAPIAVLLTMAAQLHAQRADSVHLRNDCRLAVQVLTLGQPANKRVWALEQVRQCGNEGAQAMAAALPAYAYAAGFDPALDSLVNAASSILDGQLFVAGLALAGNSAAGVGARIQGLRLALLELEPARADRYSNYLPGDTTTVWALGHRIVSSGGPIPADGAARLEALSHALLSDPAVGEPLHSAAWEVWFPLASDRICRELPAKACLDAVKTLKP